MQVTILDHTVNPEQAIARAAAICYAADTSSEANANRMVKLMQSGHLSTLRFAYATFHVAGVSRIESHQHVRVAHAGILQKSQRYTSCAQMGMIYPPAFDRAAAVVGGAPEMAVQAAFDAYHALLAAGVKKEDARYILPQGVTTEFTMTGNFQMWHGWLKARLSKHAQWEIRAVAQEIHRQLSDLAPNIFGGLLDD